MFPYNHFITQQDIGSRRICCLATTAQKTQTNLPPGLKFPNQSQQSHIILLCWYSHYWNVTCSGVHNAQGGGTVL